MLHIVFRGDLTAKADRTIAKRLVVLTPGHGIQRLADLYMIVINQLSVQQLTTESRQDEEPRWSPGGTLLAYTTHRDPVENLFVLDIAIGTSQMLTDHPSDELEPVWSPFGDYIYYRRFSDGHVARVPSAGGTPEQMTPDNEETKVSYSDLAISPGGDLLAYVSDQSGDPEIYLFNTGEPGIFRLTYAAGREAEPQFRPSGN